MKEGRKQTKWLCFVCWGLLWAANGSTLRRKMVSSPQKVDLQGNTIADVNDEVLAPVAMPFKVPPNYDKFARPAPATGHSAVDVAVNIDVRNLYDINVRDGVVTLEVRLSVQWVDSRLKGGMPKGRPWYNVQPGTLWVPRVIFSNTVTSPTTLAEVMQLSSEGSVRYIRRLKVRARCRLRPILNQVATAYDVVGCGGRLISCRCLACLPAGFTFPTYSVGSH